MATFETCRHAPTFSVKEFGGFWWLLVAAVTNSPKQNFNHCKSTICKFLSRDTKSARDKNGTKPRKNKVKNTLPEISLVENHFVCKGTNLSIEKRGEIPIPLIHNSFSYHCTPNVVFANGFDLKQRLLEDHRKANKDILTRHFYDMSNMMSRNEGIWLSNGWVKTLLWIFLPCLLYTIFSIVYFVASYIDK